MAVSGPASEIQNRNSGMVFRPPTTVSKRIESEDPEASTYACAWRVLILSIFRLHTFHPGVGVSRNQSRHFQKIDEYHFQKIDGHHDILIGKTLVWGVS
jgi:hypothetical protein